MSSPKHDQELPAYSRKPSLASQLSLSVAEHHYSLQTSKGHKWVSLFVRSRSASSKLPPLFLENDLIAGRVELDLPKLQTIKAIHISVQAGATAVGLEELSFLEVSKVVWTHPTGKTTKLIGCHSWPFSIELPHEVTLPDPNKKSKGSSPVNFRLPPSFTETASPAFIDYRLVVTVKRGALRVNQILSTNFGYRPITRPNPPSALRQLSYSEGSNLIGPDGDPEGWKVLPPLKITGNLFDVRTVQATCTLAIAAPLSYPLGTSIPLSVTIESTDAQALDVLSKPDSIHVHLVRSVATGSDATNDDAVRRSNNYFTEVAGLALFWPSNEGKPVNGQRTLQGELHVSKALKPSFIFPRFAVRYTLELLPLKAPGFQPNVEPTGTLLTERVDIVTSKAPGVHPRSYAPPGYIQNLGGDYSTAMGYLENGNQRFIHHHGFGVGLSA